jgi:cobalt-zinc-cadmium efflux system outer membrane protein
LEIEVPLRNPSRPSTPASCRRRTRACSRRLRRLIAAAIVVGPLRPEPADAQLRSPRATADTLRLTLSAARTRGLRDNADLAATRVDTVIARGALRQSSALAFNPSADVLAPMAGNGTELGVSQELEVFGQRGARVAAGRAALHRATAGILNAQRLTVGDIDRAFYRLAAASQQSALARDVLELNQRLAAVAERQLAAGEISRLDYNLAVIELGRSRTRALATQREREQVELTILQLLGLSPTTHVVPDLSDIQDDGAPDSVSGVPRAAHAHAARAAQLDPDSLTAVALARRPDLVAQSAAIEQARAEATLARREALPNVVLRGVAQPGQNGGTVFQPGIGLTLPIFNRNRGAAQARDAAARQSELQRASLVVQLRAQIAADAATYQYAAQEVEILETTVLEPARQNRQLLEIAYREGKVGLPVLLLIRNQVIDAELEYWASWLAERLALADLAEATESNTAADQPQP